MPSCRQPASQRRIASARYPTTITNLSMPAACDDSRMCSSSGAPERQTSGFGALPDREAMRLPLPAARIRHSLTVAIGHLDSLEFCLCSWLERSLYRRKSDLGQSLALRRVVEILDVHVGGAEDSRFGDALRREGEPQWSSFFVELDEVCALGPEGRIVRGVAFSAYQRIVFGVHPNEALE